MLKAKVKSFEHQQKQQNNQTANDDVPMSLTLNDSSATTTNPNDTNLIEERDELKRKTLALAGQLERLQQQYGKDRAQSEADFAQTLSCEEKRRTSEVAALTSSIAEKDATIAKLKAEVVERDTKVAAILEEGMGWSRREERQSRMNKKLRERLLATENEKEQALHQIEKLQASVTTLQTQTASDQKISIE